MSERYIHLQEKLINVIGKYKSTLPDSINLDRNDCYSEIRQEIKLSYNYYTTSLLSIIYNNDEYIVNPTYNNESGVFNLGKLVFENDDRYYRFIIIKVDPEDLYFEIKSGFFGEDVMKFSYAS